MKRSIFRVLARTRFGSGVLLALAMNLTTAVWAANGTITIVKDAVPNHATDFEFVGDFGQFELDDDGGAVGGSGALSNMILFSPPPGSYTVTEELTADWQLTDIRCNPGSQTVVSRGTRTVAIDVKAGEHVTCIFTSSQSRLRSRTPPDSC